MSFKASTFENTLDFLCEELGMAKEEAINLLLDNARIFLGQWIGKDDEYGIGLWMGMPEFWVWWRQIWYQTDLGIIGRCSRLDLLEMKQKGAGFQLYQQWHRPERISMRPPSAITAGFHKLVKSCAAPNKHLAPVK